uniref:Uncharacterized protein n=1 Tax=Cyprinodon variegatus TaxID=28743 RepID=A0A3Q2G4S9_CYPVA
MLCKCTQRQIYMNLFLEDHRENIESHLLLQTHSNMFFPLHTRSPRSPVFPVTEQEPGALANEFPHTTNMIPFSPHI